MTLLSGSSSAEIDAAIEDCWAVVADVEGAPAWQQGLIGVDVVERDDEGCPIVCDTVSDATFTKVHCRVAIVYEQPRRLTIRRIASEDVDVMDATWELAEAGAGRTRATYSLAVDPGPIPFFARPLERALRPLLVGRRADELARAVTERG